jgi:hypothetical protein
MDQGMGEEAVKLVKSCIAGPYAKDAALHFDLARAQLSAKQHSDCAETIATLEREHSAYKSGEVVLLKAHNLKAQGQTDAAISAYVHAAEIVVGEEGKYEYAQSLADAGQTERARELLERMLQNAKRQNGVYQDLNAEWLRKAKRLLGSLGNAK